MDALTKHSSSAEIKNYFLAVLKLSEASEEFPVSLDEVWPLVYSAKEKAVRALKENFIQDVDYEVLTQNGENHYGIDHEVLRKKAENSQGGRPSNEYRLTVPCMEFFIARKVRDVFEVYRKVFHKTAKQKELSSAEIILQIAQFNVAQERRLSTVEQNLNTVIEEKKQSEFDLDYLPVSDDPMPGMNLRKKILAIVNTYQRSTQMAHRTLWDSIYKKLYYNYGVAIQRCKKINKSETWLEVAERKGHLEKIYSIVSELVKAKQ